MDKRFFNFVWRHSKREQITILALTAVSFPMVYISLEIPKRIVNDAINGRDFPREVLGFELQQVPYLLVLCFAFLGMVVLINGMKWLINYSIGVTGERMLRRLRFMMFEYVMRFRISAFRRTKPGEIIQMMLGEVEPLGGFIGEVIATPAFQGGLLCVYMIFIFMQDFWLGLAAIALYPVQAILLPKMQAKVIRLNKARAHNTRVLADAIGEGITSIADIHTNDTARWHLAQISGRLYRNTTIRIDLFKRKFTIKFINNFLNQLTPFFFYSAGGYLVITGDLDFGSLVAVLAAYKDLAGPWREVLNYLQRWNDFNSRYEFVVESFMAEDMFGTDRIFGPERAPLRGDLELAGIEGGPGSGGLTAPRLTIRQGQTVAVAGGGNGARDALMRMMAGLLEPAAGRITIGGEPLTELTMPRLGATVAYVGAEPGIIARSIRDNLVYGLLRRMPDLSGQADANVAAMLREARATGNMQADPEGDWTDYEAAGVRSPEELDRRLLALVDRVGLADDMVASALDSQIDRKDAGRWTQPILAARAELAASLSAAELADIAEPWVEGRFNTNGTLLANVLFGMPEEIATGMRGYIRQPLVISALDASGARAELEAIGRDIAGEFADLVATVDENSPVLDSFAGYPKAEILAAADLVKAIHASPAQGVTDEQRETLLALALGYVQTRDRLDVVDETRISSLMDCQKRARSHLQGKPGFVCFDEPRFNPGRSIAENILNAMRRFDRKSAWKLLGERMEAAIRSAGLRDDLIRLGLGAPAGSGGSNLSATARRRLALARAMLKRPSLVVLDGVAGGRSPADVALRESIRSELPEATLVVAVEHADDADADCAIEIDDDGVAHLRQPCRPAGDAGRAAGERKRRQAT